MPARKVNITEPVDVEKDEPKVDPEPAADEVKSDPEAVESETTEEAVDEPAAWYPGAPCLSCGARNYRWSVGWGQGCNVCLDPQSEEE